jgi:hypothetical protein
VATKEKCINTRQKSNTRAGMEKALEIFGPEGKEQSR